jgi:hypothetical protein
MPLSKLELKPGINREITTYANEGGYYAGDKVRFRWGMPQKIGGWQNITVGSNTYQGVSRILWDYTTSLNQQLMGVGTNQKVYVESGGVYNDITPKASSLTLSSNPFTTSSGSLLVAVSATAHGAVLNTYVSFSSATAVGGVTLSGNYEIIDVPDDNHYSVIAPNVATSTATGGGAGVTAVYDIDAGTATYGTGLGWGGPPWGFGGWGSGTAVGVPMRTWSMLNFGDDLIFAEREGPIYYWELETISWTPAITLDTEADSITKSTTFATFASGSTTIVVSDASFLSTGSVISGSGIASGAYITTSWNGGQSVTLSSATTSSGTLTAITSSYAGRHVPNKVFMIVDSPVNNFLIVLGSNPYNPLNFDEPFNPMLVRWSDQDNAYEWVPQITNQSGETPLSHGSYIVTGISTRQEIVIFSNTAVYSMQYLGPPFVWGLTLLDQDISISSQNACTSINNVVYWMGTDKFFVYSGRVETLPCTLREYVFTDINKDQFAQVMCGSNEAFSEVWWFYPSSGSLINDRYVIFNYVENVWSYGNLSRTAWAEHTTRGYPLLSFSVQNSYLSSSILSTDTSITLLDASSYPTSGEITIGSEIIYYGSISNNVLGNCIRGYKGTTATSHIAYSSATYIVPNQVMFHEIGCDDNSTGSPKPIDAYVETSDFDIGDGHNIGFVWRIIPDMKFVGSTGSSPSVTLTVKPRQNSGSNYTSGDSPTVTRTATFPIEQYTGQVYTRVRGRQMSFRVSSDDIGSAWQMGAMRIDVRPDGKR